MTRMRNEIFCCLLGLLVFNVSGRDIFISAEQKHNKFQVGCDAGSDALACIKLKAARFLEDIFQKDRYKLTENIEIRSNRQFEEVRSSQSVLQYIESYLETHDVSMNVPGTGAEITISPRNIDADELDVKIKFANENASGSDEARRNKMKRMVIPIMALILLKAMTVIPLALGILGLKAFNALQLGFTSFLVSAALVFFQICKKLAIGHHHPNHVVPHAPWDGRANKNLIRDGPNLAYKAYI